MQIPNNKVVCEIQPDGSSQITFLDSQPPYVLTTNGGLTLTSNTGIFNLPPLPAGEIITVINGIKCKFIKPVGEQPGCTDPCAPNYNPMATTDDGSCEPYDDYCNQDCLAGAFGGTWDSVGCTCVNEVIPVYGCTDPAAFNYDPNVNCNDDSCNYEGCCICCAADGSLIFNSSNNELDCETNPGFDWLEMSCEEVLSDFCLTEEPGCTNPCAPNYNPDATYDDGSCIFLPIACNMEICFGDITQWNPVSCSCVVVVPSVLGCTNPTASNYNPDANCDDGSCIYPPEGCCICCEDGGITYNGSNNQAACEAQPGFIWVTIECEQVPQNYFCPGPGCTDTNACNYNPSTSEDNGTCDYSCQCFSSLQLSGNIPSSEYHSSSIIQSTAIVDSDKTVELYAPDCIHLDSGTSIKAGSSFKVKIENCAE